VIFRDHFLSDLIGFVYSRMEAREAAQDFLARIRENCRSILSSGRDALVPIILDGENAWEYYDHNGRPFLRELYQRISDASDMSALTVSEALGRIDADPLDHIFPGSWINANFDIWIGAGEDNQAWESLLAAREAFDAAKGVAEEKRSLAFEELLIAEGSDWFWWYGPDFTIDTDFLFDELFRLHLQNVYRILGVEPPAHLEVPICLPSSELGYTQPLRLLSPSISGETERYFNWLGAGQLDLTTQQTAMFQGDRIGQKLFFGFGPNDFFLRLDLSRHPEAITVRFLLPHPARVTLRQVQGGNIKTLFETSGLYSGSRIPFARALGTFPRRFDPAPASSR